MKKISFIIALLAFSTVVYAALTPVEITDIENAFGITLTTNQIEELDAVVNPTNTASWRTDAYARIEQNRKADLDIQVVDMNGDPVEGAQVSVQLKKNDFKFGGIVTVMDLTDANGNLSAEGSTSNDWQRITTNLFNAVGLNNGFKPRITSQHEYIPGFLDWAATHNLSVRGHLLMWPGGGSTNDLSGTPGVDYGNHLSTDSTSAYASYNVLGAVENWIDANPAQKDAQKTNLKNVVDAEIAEWASQWDVYEWDVINETLGNTLLQEILGYDQMAEWFKIAETNKVSSNTGLYINEYKIISADYNDADNQYNTRKGTYTNRINTVIADGGSITGIGFQSRFKYGHISPETVYNRLDEFATLYPNLTLAGTEFEIKDGQNLGGTTNVYDELTRAQMTEEIMTTYFSHDQVIGLNAWNFMSAPTDLVDPTEPPSALVWYDGTIKLNGLVWYYLHRIRYNTDATLSSGLDGQTGLRAFKGDYDVSVGYKGQTVDSTLTLSSNQTVIITLNSVVADDPNTTAVIDVWNYDGLTNGAELSSAMSTGAVGGVSITDGRGLSSIQNETVRWQSDGVADSLYKNVVPSSYVGASNGLFQLSMDYLDADFSASAVVSNGSGRVALGIRDNVAGDAYFRLVFNSGGGSAPEFRLEVTDDLNNNQTVATFPGSTLDHLSVRAVYDFDNAGSVGSYKVYYRFGSGSEIAARTTGQLPAGFALDQLRLTVQTFNGGVNWQSGDRIYTDNMILRSLGEAPPVFFTLDPISKPSVSNEVAYTGQSIAGTATNALSYSKVTGPAWLSIAANGDLSGTPTRDDVGQNSWIVQASNGDNTDTAVLSIFVNGSGTGEPGSSISINQVQTQGFNVTGGSSGTSSYTGISAQVGDVIVLTVAGNKKGSVTPLSCAKVGGTGTVGTQTELTNDLNTYPTSWAWYQTVTSSGTFDFDITTDNTAGITAITALYVMRADSGTVQLANSATWDDADNSDNGTSYSLDYTFSSALPDGILIESISSRTDLITEPATYTEDNNGQNKRILASYDGITGSSWRSVYTLSDGQNNKQTSGAVGLVFTEITSGGNAPPVFTTDPVSESSAEAGTVYTGSTLADNASDGDNDPLNFLKVSGPTWLTVATNGVLSGIPASDNLGTNRWKVSVTDGTATNFATLKIIVSSPLPIVSPQAGTNVLFIAIDDMKPLLGCYGDKQALTPRIDSLAAQGVTFLNAECQWAVCGPSRASLMTGLYPEEGGVMGFKKMRGNAVNTSRNNTVVRPNVVTLQQYFRYNGYRTAATGKVNDPRCVGTLDTTTGKVAEDGSDVDDPPSWGDPVNPNALPSDFFSNSSFAHVAAGWSPAGKPSIASNDAPDSTFTDGIICDEGLTLLNSLAAGDTQFFLGVGFKKPHLPFVAPQQYWDLYNRSDFSVAPFQSHPLNEVSYTWNYGAELVGYDDINDVRDSNGLLIVPETKQLELIHGYYACASFIDAQIGRLLDRLETLGLNTNTIVVIWGDHGFHLGDHSEWAKHTNLEQAAHAPLIIYSPFTGQAGAKPTAPAAFVDIYPTLCELAGLPIPEQPLAENEAPTAPASGRALKGSSLIPMMNDPSVSLRTGALTLFSRNGAMGYSYRTERYRYIEWVDTGDNAIVARELYDYEVDPLETVNLAGEPGFDALMYQFSKSMRKELDDQKLGTSDIGATELQGSSAASAPTNRILPTIGGGITGSNINLFWPDADGATYNILQKTNLLDSIWSTNQTDVTGSPATLPVDKESSFFRIEVSN